MSKLVQVARATMRNTPTVLLLAALVWLFLGCGPSAEPAAGESVANPAARSTGADAEPTRVETVVVPDTAATEPMATSDNAATEPIATSDNGATEPITTPDNAATEPMATPDNAAIQPIATPQQTVVAPDHRPDAPAVGTQVGNHIPSFTMRLVDGTRVTSAELLKEGQPTFLITFTTW